MKDDKKYSIISIEVCRACKGKGWYVRKGETEKHTCQICEGTGKLRKEKEITVKLTPLY